jgi:hypothetical protein
MQQSIVGLFGSASRNNAGIVNEGTIGTIGTQVYVTERIQNCVYVSEPC